MRIAEIAPLQVATPPLRYGGTERVISSLTEGLTRLGHEVTLFATGDSRTDANLVAEIPRAVNFDSEIDVTAYHVAMLEKVYQRAGEFDIIHSHLDYLTLPWVGRTTVPTVITLHGRIDRDEFGQVFRTFAKSHADGGAHYVAISDAQRRTRPQLNWAATIHHGIDVRSFEYYPKSGDYLCFMGRIAPEKGPEQAIEIAKRAGIPLKIAAKVDSKDRPYFIRSVEPLLDHPLIEFVGEVGEAEKRELIGNAMALLLPIDWPEPFGLVFIESLALGTPVLTSPCGAAPELLRHGTTGFLSKSVDDFVDAVAQLSEIDRDICRREALERFDLRRMAMDYAKLYARLSGARRPAERRQVAPTKIKVPEDDMDSGQGVIPALRKP